MASVSSPKLTMAERWRAFHKFYAGHEPSWGAAKVTEVTKHQLSLCGRDDQQFGELLSKLTSRYMVSRRHGLHGCQAVAVRAITTVNTAVGAYTLTLGDSDHLRLYCE